MTTPLPTFHQCSDQDLLREVTRLAARERDATARLIASLAELDARRLYLGEGCASLFTYCVHVLHLSEHAAYDRIEVARAVRRFPAILAQLTAGAVTLTRIRLLAPHLTDENHAVLLAEAQHRPRREVERIIARLHPRPDVPSVVRKLPTPPPPDPAAATDGRAARVRPAAQGETRLGGAASAGASVPPPSAPAPRQPAVVAPLAPARYKVTFTISAETYAKLQEAQALLRHVIPTGDPAAIVDRALTLLVAESARMKYAATDRPRVSRATPSEELARGAPSDADGRAQSRGARVDGAGPESAARSRHIPAAVKRTVWDRDGGPCAFVSASGKRCVERGFLEFHHRRPYAKGGEASVDNLELRCKLCRYRHKRHYADWRIMPRRGRQRGKALRVSPIFASPKSA